MKDTYEHPEITTGFDRSLSEALAKKHGIVLERQMQAQMGAGFGLILDDDSTPLFLRAGKAAQAFCILFAGIVPNLFFMKYALGWF